jgi:16S rRNA (cytosine967-C5)-methyltransferase
VLVYAVCSLEREEGEDHAARVALEPFPIASSELPAGLHPTPEGWLRTDPGLLPEHGGLDGFFVARWRIPPRDGEAADTPDLVRDG